MKTKVFNFLKNKYRNAVASHLVKITVPETMLTVYETGDRFPAYVPSYLAGIYINQYRDGGWFAQELVAKLDSPLIGIGDVPGNAIYFTGKELSALRQIINDMPPPREMEADEESAIKKIMREIQNRESCR